METSEDSLLSHDTETVGALSNASVMAKSDSPHTSRPSKYIKAGDLVIIFISRDRPPMPLTITPGHEYNNNYGTFLHDNMIGLPFGAKVSLGAENIGEHIQPFDTISLHLDCVTKC
jgi:hypothetical protein